MPALAAPLTGAAAPRAALRRVRPNRLALQAQIHWSLTLDRAWCEKHPRKSKALAPVSLTGEIGRKHLVSTPAALSSCLSEGIHYAILDHGVDIVFEAEGSSNPLDAPSIPYLTDVGSQCEVRVDGAALPKGARTRVSPGAVLRCGKGLAVYQLQQSVLPPNLRPRAAASATSASPAADAAAVLPPKLFHVYRLLNTRTGRFYIGVTEDLKSRFVAHRSSPNARMRKDCDLYPGWRDHLTMAVLETHTSQRYAERREALHIARSGARGAAGYNTLGGRPSRSRQFWYLKARGIIA